MHDLIAVFKRLWKIKLYIKKSKCALYLKNIGFLGHVVSADGVSVQTSKIDTIKNWSAPATIPEL